MSSSLPAARSFKVMIAYPPIMTKKGVALLAQNRQFQYFNAPTFIYPVIPAYAATRLKQAGYQVVWADAIAEQKTPAQFAELFLTEAPDLIVMEVKTPVVKKYWHVIEELKRLRPETVTALMGDHVTALPEESLENSPVDYVLTGGDFDFALLNLADHLSGGIPLEPGVYWREQGKIVSSGVFETKHTLADMPIIDRGLTKWELYAYQNGNYKYLPGTYTMIGRDCWWRQDGGCTFCSWTTTFPNFRTGTPEQMMAEVENCVENYGIREIFDDTGTFPAGGWLERFCNMMIERGYHKRVKIGCNMRPGALNQKQYDLMGKAGFRFILYGMESANHGTLVKINKGQKEHDMFETARMAKQAGLAPHTTCMVGYPWESYQEAKNTIDLTRDLFARGWIDTLQATIIIPYPGTQLFKQAQENGWLRTTDWDEYDMRKPIMNVPFPDEVLMRLTQGIYKSFITPRFVLRKLSEVRNIDDVKFLSRAGWKVFGHLLDFSKKQPIEAAGSTH